MRLKSYMRSATCMIVAAVSIACGSADDRTPPMLVKGDSFTLPTQEQKRWALATCAILTESNQGRHDILGGDERTPKEIKAWQDSLAQWWGDKNREDLLGSLKWIEEGGHRREFDAMARDLSLATPAQLSDIRARVAANPSVSNKVEIVMKYKAVFKHKSITAWDYDRYVALCGWGYIAGYLSEEEAWQKIMPVARLLQKTFSSWSDLGVNHVVGREFWSLKQTQESGNLTRKAYHKLLNDPSSPWVQLKWNTDLSPVKPEEKTP